MLIIELVPDLDHCIETVAKKKHSELSSTLLEKETCDAEIEAKLEILRIFLETVDFQKLRAEYEPYLVEGKKVRFIVYSAGNITKYEIHLTNPAMQD
ncbi:MAG: hypothetical protein JXA46_14180 [Dehalococcoidales bacterium]|nr:hypothetical protein [Dehalococcoidales bacterium]